MSRAEYNANRQRLAEIQGVDLSAGTHNCHHAYIFQEEARRNRRLRRDLDKIDNLYLLPIPEHNRLHQMLDARKAAHETPKRPRQKKKRR